MLKKGLGRLAYLVLPVLIFLLIFSNMAFAQPLDVNNHWAKDAITDWVNKGLIKGYSDGTFKPDQNITRAEFMSLVNGAFGFEAQAEIDYLDVPANSWFRDIVARAKAAGYISGYPDGTMRPNNPITRQEAAVIIMKLLQLEPDYAGADEFSDAVGIPAWSKGAVGALVKASIMGGYPDGSFQGANPLKRAEAIVALQKTLARIFLSQEAQVLVEADKNALEIGFAKGDSYSHVTQNISLPGKGAKGSDIAWASNNEAVVTSQGVVKQGTKNHTVILTATITKGSATATKTFQLTVIAKKEKAGGGGGGEGPVMEQVAAPTANPSPGTYGSQQSVILACSTVGAEVWYTLDGSDPRTSETRQEYTDPITISATIIIKTYAAKAGMKDSAVKSFNYVIEEADNYSRSFPVMAYDPVNNRYLMIYFKHNALGDYNLYGSLVAANGDYIGSEFPIRSSQEFSNPDYNYKPDVAYDSINRVFLVVLNEGALIESKLNWDIYGQIISVNGEKVGDAFAITSLNDGKSQITPYLDFDNINSRFLVAYKHNVNDTPYRDDIHGCFVSIGGENPVVGEDMVIYTHSSNSQSLNDVVFNGENKFMVPIRSSTSDYLVPVNAGTGEVGEPYYFGYTATKPSLAFDNVNQRFLAAWFSGNDVYGGFITQDGSKDGNPFKLSDSEIDQYRNVSVAYAGETFYVAWDHIRLRIKNIAAKKIDAATGALSDLISITEGVNYAYKSFVCGGDSGALVAWTEEQTGVPDVIRLQHLAPPATPAGFTVAPKAVNLTLPEDITVNLTVDKAATAYYAVVQREMSGFPAPAPTAEQLKELGTPKRRQLNSYGVVPVLAAGCQLLSGQPDGEQITIDTDNNNFKADRTYTVYVVLETEEGILSEVAGAEFDTLDDINPPVFYTDDPYDSSGVWGKKARSLLIGEKVIDYDEYYDLYIYVVKTADAPVNPTSLAEYVKDEGMPYGGLTSGVYYNFTYTGLEPGTEYNVYMVALDNSCSNGLYSEVLVDSVTTLTGEEGPCRAGIADKDCYRFESNNKYLFIQFDKYLHVEGDPGFFQELAGKIKIAGSTLAARGDAVTINNDTLKIEFANPPAEDFQLDIDAGALKDTNTLYTNQKINISVDVPDITPAQFVTDYPQEYAAGISDHSIAAEVEFNEAVAVFWALLPAGAAEPEYESRIVDKAIPGALQYGSISIDKWEPAVISISGLTGSTSYDLWLTAIDGNANWTPMEKITLTTR